jgi:hypothetical protein
MSKRWTRKAKPPKDEKPMSLEDKLRNYGQHQIFRLPLKPGQRKRLRKTANEAYGRAVGLRGAAKGAAMRKLASLPLEGILSPEQINVITDPAWDKKPRKATVKKGDTSE